MARDRTIEVKFDIDASGLRPLFDDVIARTIYLTIAPGHIISGRFPSQCLSMARRVRSEGLPLDGDDVRRLLGVSREFEGVTIDPNVCNELCDYLNGKGSIGYSESARA